MKMADAGGKRHLEAYEVMTCGNCEHLCGAVHCGHHARMAYAGDVACDHFVAYDARTKPPKVGLSEVLGLQPTGAK